MLPQASVIPMSSPSPTVSCNSHEKQLLFSHKTRLLDVFGRFGCNMSKQHPEPFTKKGFSGRRLHLRLRSLTPFARGPLLKTSSKASKGGKSIVRNKSVKTRSNSFHSTLEPNTEVFSKVSRSLAQFTLVNSFSTLLNKGGSTCNCPSASQDF